MILDANPHRPKQKPFRSILWVVQLAFATYVGVVSVGLLQNPVRRHRVTFLALFIPVWVLVGLGAWREERADKRLKG